VWGNCVAWVVGKIVVVWVASSSNITPTPLPPAAVPIPAAMTQPRPRTPKVLSSSGVIGQAKTGTRRSVRVGVAPRSRVEPEEGKEDETIVDPGRRRRATSDIGGEGE